MAIKRMDFLKLFTIWVTLSMHIWLNFNSHTGQKMYGKCQKHNFHCKPPNGADIGPYGKTCSGHLLTFHIEKRPINKSDKNAPNVYLRRSNWPERINVALTRSTDQYFDWQPVQCGACLAFPHCSLWSLSGRPTKRVSLLPVQRAMCNVKCAMCNSASSPCNATLTPWLLHSLALPVSYWHDASLAAR